MAESREEIEAMNLDDIADFYRQLYTNPNGLVCVVCGNFDMNEVERDLVRFSVCFPHKKRLMTGYCRNLITRKEVSGRYSRMRMKGRLFLIISIMGIMKQDYQFIDVEIGEGCCSQSLVECVTGARILAVFSIYVIILQRIAAGRILF